MKQESGARTLRRSMEVGDLDARAVTRLRVLNAIREAGRASRTDLAAALKLSPATVTFVTSGLMAGGLIEEVPEKDAPDTSRRGRPRVALRLTRGRLSVAGIKVAREVMSVLVLDFDGTELAQREVPLPEARMEPRALVLAIRAALEQTCADISGGIDTLAGVSIGMAGQIDAGARFVHWSSSLVGRNVDLAPLLHEHLPCAAFVENDANLVAKAEHLFGQAKGLSNFLVVTVEHGVGLGIVLDGKLYRGERGCGAEFGHTKVALDGADCQCGQKGCLEAYVGGYALQAQAVQSDPALAAATVADLIAAGRAGHGDVADILERAGHMFGMGLSNLINLFDPECIIIAGARDPLDHLQTDAVRARIRQGVVSVDAPLPAIRSHSWGDLMWARGAAALGIEQVSALKIKELA
ncbi:MAG: ROK family transcriptional regulator [Pseudomonadota bacterium]